MLIGRSPSRIGSGLRRSISAFCRVDYRESAESCYIAEVFRNSTKIPGPGTAQTETSFLSENE